LGAARKMTTLLKTFKNCIFCQHTTEITSYGSTNEFGSPDLDLRPAEMRRSTINMWIEVCKNCNFSWNDIEDKEIDVNVLKKVMDTNEWKNLNLDKHTNDLSLNFERHAMISREMGMLEQTANSYLHAAWAADDADIDSDSIKYRNLSVEYFLKYLKIIDETSRDSFAINALISDLLRVTKRYEENIQFIKDNLIKISDEQIQKILNFQLQKSLLQDSKIYKVSDVFN